MTNEEHEADLDFYKATIKTLYKALEKRERTISELNDRIDHLELRLAQDR